MRFVYINIAGIILGIATGILSLQLINRIHFKDSSLLTPLVSNLREKQVIGFLPYWLLKNADKDYSPYLTTLSYFALRLDSNGSIQKLDNPQEEEPGWSALSSGKLDKLFKSLQKKGINLSLVLASGDNESIGNLLSEPDKKAKKTVSEVIPLLNKYGFSDLNLDIEYTGEASASSRIAFTKYVQTVRDNLSPNFNLTIEVTGDDLIRKKLIDPMAIGQIADNIVVMAYDFHHPGSIVTGGVAPLGGAGINLEYDVTSAMLLALKGIPNNKLILGVPLYGYSWETLSLVPHSAVIPGSGIVASSKRVEKLLSECATCSATFDDAEKEQLVEYTDTSTGTIYQIFVPDRRSTNAKVDLANNLNLGGVALWALGYEGNAILEPLRSYK